MSAGRSSQIQQRVLALNTVAKILENCRLGLFDSSFDRPLLPVLLDNNLLLVLRFCLDDGTPAVVSAALTAFARLLSCPFDEICLQRCFHWYGGDVQPILSSRVPIDPADQEQEPEIKDHEMVRLFLIFKHLLQVFFFIKFGNSV